MADWTIRFRFGGIESSLEYLEAMAAKGWMLESWHKNTLFFRRTIPGKWRFAMDIVPSRRWSVDSDEYNEKVRQEYVSIYEEAGWQYVDNQDRKFILRTKREELPLPQTDPVAYEETIYTENKKRFQRYCVLSILGMLVLGHVWKYLYTYLISVTKTFLLGIYACLTMAGLLFSIRHGIRMRREKLQLKQGLIPQIHDREWLARGGIICVLLAMALAVMVMGVIYGFQSILVWGWLLCSFLMILCDNVLPWFLHCRLHISKAKAARMVKRVNMLLLIIGYAILWSNTFGESKFIRDPYPEQAATLVTKTEIFGGEEDADYPNAIINQSQMSVAKMYQYFYYNHSDTTYFGYHLLVSNSKAAHRSFERNPDVNHLSDYMTEDRIKGMKPYMSELNIESLQVTKAWTAVREMGMYTYFYYMETDHAALFLKSSREIPQEWIETIGKRLAQIS